MSNFVSLALNDLGLKDHLEWWTAGGERIGSLQREKSRDSGPPTRGRGGSNRSIAGE